MQIYKVDFIDGYVHVPGDLATLDHEAPIRKSLVLTCSAAKRAKEIVKQLHPNAEQVHARSLGFA